MADTKLLTPGPVDVPDFVMQAIAKPVIPHRSPAFEAFYHDLLRDLTYLFQTQQQTCCMIGSGTYGVESAMYSLFRPGDQVMIISMGKFSQRWVDYASILQLDAIVIDKEWGQTVSISELAEVLKEHPGCKGVMITHCETSTGVLVDLEEIVWNLKQVKEELLVCVDAITSVGAVPFYFDAWMIDCAVVASQKSLMNPAGVCAFALSTHAEKHMVQTHASDARNLYNYIDFARKHNFPYTPPVQLLYGMKASLEYIQKLTLPTIWNQVHHKARVFRNGLAEIDGVLFGADYSSSLTAFSLPGSDLSEIKEKLEKDFHIILSGGQGHLKGQILRISHMGMSTDQDMRMVIDRIKQLL